MKKIDVISESVIRYIQFTIFYIFVQDVYISFYIFYMISIYWNIFNTFEDIFVTNPTSLIAVIGCFVLTLYYFGEILSFAVIYILRFDL